MNSRFRNDFEIMLLCEMERYNDIDSLNNFAEEVVEQVEIARQTIEDDLDE